MNRETQEALKNHNSNVHKNTIYNTILQSRNDVDKNRQNSIDNVDQDMIFKWNRQIREHFAKAKALYDEMIKDGIAKECARFILPLATPTRLYMSGSIRNWIHYIELRSANGTQKEHQDIAVACAIEIAKIFPS